MAVDLEFEIGIFILFIHPTVTDAHFRFYRQHFRFLFGFVPFKNIYVFKWNKAEQEAEVLSIKPEMSIRYRWMDEEDENAYFEFQIHSHELTGSTSLQITDFAEQDEKKDSIDLWDTQVEELKRTLGI